MRKREDLLVERRWLWIGGGVVLAAISLMLAAWLTAGDGDAAFEDFSPAAVALGAGVYASNCASCHGASGEGQPNWRERLPNGVLPAPPHDPTGHTWHHADGLLYRLIRDGGAQFAGPTTPTGMPAFGEALTDEEIRAVIAYLKSQWGDEERAFQSQVSVGDPLP
jgi:mono/diheme cytochrome c family protein